MVYGIILLLIYLTSSLYAIPNKAPPNISQVELTLYLKTRNSAPIASAIVNQSITLARPNSQVTAVINPNEATFTPSRNDPDHHFLRKIRHDAADQRHKNK